MATPPTNPLAQALWETANKPYTPPTDPEPPPPADPEPPAEPKKDSSTGGAVSLNDFLVNENSPEPTDPPAGDPPPTDPPAANDPPADPPAGDPPAGDPPAGDPPPVEPPAYTPPSADDLQDPAPADPPPPAVNPDDVDLLPQEREELELLDFAEENMKGDKFKGVGKKMRKFFKAHREYIAEKVEEDPDWEPDPKEDEKYGRWLKKNRPDLSDRDIRSIERAIDRKEAVDEARKEFQPVYDELHKLKTEPLVAKKTKAFADDAASLAPADMAELVKDGIGKIAEEYPMEHEVISEISKGATQYVREYLDVFHQIKPFDSNNPTHTGLSKFIEDSGAAFEAKGGTARVRDGKSFVSLSKFNALSAKGQGAAYWTFSDDDVVNLIKDATKTQISAKIAEERKRMEVYMKRAGTVPPAAGQPPATPANTPVPTPRPPRPQPSGRPSGEPPPPGNSLSNVLWGS